MSNITLKELARKLGISVSTVSKALNDSFEISDETKQRVREMADAHQYRPNILAKSLKTGRSNTLAVLIPYLSNPFQSQVLEGAHQAAFERNYKLVFMQSRENEQLEQESLNVLQQQNVDGVIISPSANSDLKFLKQFHQQCPLVLVDRIDFELDTFKIGVSNEKGAFDATQHLIDTGRKDIFLLVGRNIGVNQKRIAGYKKALMANYIDVKESNIIQVEYGQSREVLVKNLSLILKERIGKDAHNVGLLGTTDTLTVSSLGILSNLGIAVPEQVAVIGFANTEAAESLNPSLSTIVQPAYDMGYQAVEKLISLLQSKNRFDMEFDTTILDSKMILRNSTRV
ncbi:LacI family DNA-binding transcriptional regulator [Sphingobacterium humi]|uniref:Substrate-binding domain-containing protein n=1 Tax=Sphingobacterium humi TaxID=1796905 RepID=A0A6N8L2B5_9SPHI|nr:LacI family DNA-binding transcriptional regulator [Sphingobacterium humi]MVZ63437.1 substrate-binding domain-containing protein [Sphingobacterium humi]